MVSKKEKYWVLWPRYFDASVSQREGRRVPRSLAIPSPKLEDIAKAAKLAGFQTTTEEGKAHPATWWDKQGRLLIPRKFSKTKTLKMVGEKLKGLQASGQTTKLIPSEQKVQPHIPITKLKKIKKQK